MEQVEFFHIADGDTLCNINKKDKKNNFFL